VSPPKSQKSMMSPYHSPVCLYTESQKSKRPSTGNKTHWVQGALDSEHGEASRYGISKSKWKRMNRGRKTVSASTIKDLQNVDSSLSDVTNKGKVKRVERIFKSGTGVQQPIIMKRKDGSHELVAGNTRFLTARARGENPKITVVKEP